MWYLIIVEGDAVGAIEVTDRNEIGVAVFDRYKRRGYATQALRLFMDTHRPLPAIPAIRNGHWLANVAMGNKPSRLFFWKAGFRPIQETYCHD
jgi:RimJ/RimL family protein N-acetyltransferase